MMASFSRLNSAVLAIEHGEARALTRDLCGLSDWMAAFGLGRLVLSFLAR